MSTTKGYKITTATPDRNGIAAAQQLVGAGAVIMDGDLVSGGVYRTTDTVTDVNSGVVTTGRVARKISFYSGSNLSAVNFSVTGTLLPGGPSVTETGIVGPNNSTVLSSNYFVTVTAVAADAAVGADVEVGTGNTTTSNQIATPPIILERKLPSFAVAVTVNAGTVSVDAQQTIQPILANTSDYSSLDGTGWKDITNATAVTSATTLTNSIIPTYAVRAVTNSYSTGAIFTLHVLEPDND